MYSVVLLAAMTSTGPASCGGCSAPRICCPVSYGCCGTVQFFWSGLGGAFSMAPHQSQLWRDYVEALHEPERSDAQDLWNRADDLGRQKLLAQIATMQRPDKAKDSDPDRTMLQSLPSPDRLATRTGVRSR